MSDVVRQTIFDIRCWWRNGEQLLLMLILPTMALLLGRRISETIGIDPVVFVDGVVLLAFFATAFTGQAILTAFDRRSNALLVIGASSIGRRGFVLARMAAVIVTCIAQALVLYVVHRTAGLEHPRFLGHTAIAMLGIPAFVGTGLLLAGLLRAEIVLAAANLLFVLAIVFGGAFEPSAWSPLGAIRLLQSGVDAGLAGIVLTAWTVGATVVTQRTFRWID